MSIGLCHRAADAEARLTVEEATFYNKGADEIDAWAEKIGQEPCFFSALVVRLCAQFSKVELLLAEGFGRVPRIMKQVALQQGFLRRFLKV